jgi:hypothetical protein
MPYCSKRRARAGGAHTSQPSVIASRSAKAETYRAAGRRLVAEPPDVRLAERPVPGERLAAELWVAALLTTPLAARLIILCLLTDTGRLLHWYDQSQARM